MATLAELEAILGHTFVDAGLIVEALTHTSFGHENKSPNNERLEFLGDSVLNAATTALLYEKFPSRPEGALSRLRSRLVNTDTLAALARGLHLGNALRLGVGEEASGGREKNSILADTLEAVVGALYLDGGPVKAAEMVQRWMLPLITELHQNSSAKRSGFRDPRSRFQEWVQQTTKATPTFRLAGRAGPDHAPMFTVEAIVSGTVVSTGSGRSKRLAIQHASENAMRTLSGEE